MFFESKDFDAWFARHAVKAERSDPANAYSFPLALLRM
jgi:hypothetical protein